MHGRLLLVQRDLSAPACNDCHGNHGAYPPGVTLDRRGVRTMPRNNASLFNKSPHKPAFDQLGLPECATCHSNHDIHRASDTMLGGETGAVCRRCHEPGRRRYKAAVTMRTRYRPAEGR